MTTPTVLIVDDDAGVVFACQRTFEGEGYHPRGRAGLFEG